MSNLAVKVYGIPEAAAAMRELPRRVQFKHMRVALNAAAGVIRDSARSIVRRQSGLLARSLKIKVSIPDASYNVRHHGKPAYAVIGPARNVVGPVVNGRLLSIRKATKRVVSGEGGVQTRRPSRYAHLVERGHGGKRPARPYPFLSTAITTSRDSALAKATQKLQAGIAQEAAAIYNSSGSLPVLTAG